METKMAGHKQTQRVVSRLSRIEGHVRAVKRMVENGRPCAEVLMQIAAVRAALDKSAKVLLADHMEHCILDCSHGGNSRKLLAELRVALERFIA
ncbi:MAG: metal-sensing transcriptional repressor [Planctomycetes bacterium]|nr:metal-sensing transcriptional repressor [Planctomycetota bacterium]